MVSTRPGWRVTSVEISGDDQSPIADVCLLRSADLHISMTPCLKVDLFTAFPYLQWHWSPDLSLQGKVIFIFFSSLQVSHPYTYSSFRSRQALRDT